MQQFQCICLAGDRHDLWSRPSAIEQREQLQRSDCRRWHGSDTQAAKVLEISRTALYDKLRRMEGQGL